MPTREALDHKLEEFITTERLQIERHERHLAFARHRRDTLILKMLGRGFTERSVSALAGVSSPAVHQLKRRYAAGKFDPSASPVAIGRRSVEEPSHAH